MQIFNVTDLVASLHANGRNWAEFLRVAALSMGVYRLSVGEPDLQQPHTEDEVYLVLSGKASFQAGQQRQSVAPGTLIYVERSVEHRFYDVTEDLSVLVFFAPSEHSLSKPDREDHKDAPHAQPFD